MPTTYQPNQSIELISFKLCPFVQRSVITLLHKGIDFKIQYVDLANKPDWFLALSPLGKVPVLKYGDQVLFESAVINEFLDEITEGSLMPTDPLQKAKDRGWIEYASQVLMAQYQTSMAKNEDDYHSALASLKDKLSRLENLTSENAYFNGDDLALIDTALAPLFTRFAATKTLYAKDWLAEFPRLSGLGERLLALPAVQRSVVDDFNQLYAEYWLKAESHLALSNR
ncbi:MULTISPECIES: glutathione S-transferase family protein [unclassified Agarivorans]|uniref:glutathione S-transferase family protein n=1 Tax=unclassified Agarivorans TaxID=2636026 RepID=UPI0026E2EE13|nr:MULTISPECIES: glutathione S-transferase family protein [unclassified Agarivorans]MDO6687214.1 glutathione S-transferase family protein [Agarivorans sp. 3_MG-2023]MDO6716859.1 glutathione S-transferase family protein [Agarivorans sp. 2_MG-2023]